MVLDASTTFAIPKSVRRNLAPRPPGYPPTPEPREETPCPEDPWQGLEWERERFHYDEEEYQFAKLFLKERLIDEEPEGCGTGAGVWTVANGPR